MKTTFKVLKGSSYEVERQLNQLKKQFEVSISGVTATNERITIIAECCPIQE